MNVQGISQLRDDLRKIKLDIKRTDFARLVNVTRLDTHFATFGVDDTRAIWSDET